MKHIEKFEKYHNYKQIFEVEMGGSGLLSSSDNKLNEEDYEKILGRKGKLSKHLRKNNRVFTFGMLKSIFDDANAYKKKREMIKGGYKMIHRAIPMLLAYVYFPIWILGNVLGFSRALNKILKPLLKNPETSYNRFLIKFIHGIISITEGEIKYIMGKDWFYKAFVMEDDLLKMLKKEVLREFAIELATHMESKDPEEEVPHHYIENSLKKYLNKKYNINPPMGLK